MSHQAYIGVLAHHEPRSARPTSFIPTDQADTLVANLVAERISRRVIKMFAPSSVFLSIQRPNQSPLPDFVSLAKLAAPMRLTLLKHLPLAEIPGLKVRRPDTQRVHHQLQISVVRHSWGMWRDDLKRASVEINHGCTPTDDVRADRSSLKLPSSSISTEAIA